MAASGSPSIRWPRGERPAAPPATLPRSRRLAVLWLRSPGINIPQDWPSPGQYIDLQTENHSFEEMSISQGRSGTLLGLDQPYP